MISLTDIPRRVPNVISRVVDGEAVLVHLGQNKIRVLNLWAPGCGSWRMGSLRSARLPKRS